MIQVSQLQKTYGAQTLFEDVTFSLQRRERVGLLGRNGHGKSTLFRIILKQEEADSGEVIIPKGYRVGHLPQTITFTEKTVVEEACLGLHADERDQQWKAERILTGLGFTEEGMLQAPSSFSGGFQLRINLAKLLLSEPDLLLLDEPTNYLDIVSVRWLERELVRWPGELMIISHDREFMDCITTHTMMIHRGKVRKAEGDTHKLQNLIAVDEEVYGKTLANQNKRREETQAFIDRFRAQAAKASLVQSRIKELERMGEAEELAEIQSLEFSFTEKPFEPKFILHAEDVTFGYKADDILIKDLSFSVKKGARIGIIGKNGRGKSTLLKILCGELKALSGDVRLHEHAEVGYFGQTNVQRLNQNNTVEKEIISANPKLSRTQIRGICGAMMFSGDAAEKKVSVLSGGEKSRVLLGKILATPSNILLLDEPTSHLDIHSVDALVESLKSFSGAVLIVTHSEMILRELCESLIVFTDRGAEYYHGNYDDFLRERGWDGEDGETPSKEKKSNSAEANRKKRKIEDQFKKLDLKIRENEKQLAAASTAGNVNETIELAKVKHQLEEQQLKVLEELEKL